MKTVIDEFDLQKPYLK